MMVRGGMMCMKSRIEFLEYGLHICRCMQLARVDDSCFHSDPLLACPSMSKPQGPLRGKGSKVEQGVKFCWRLRHLRSPSRKAST